MSRAVWKDDSHAQYSHAHAFPRKYRNVRLTPVCYYALSGDHLGYDGWPALDKGQIYKIVDYALVPGDQYLLWRCRGWDSAGQTKLFRTLKAALSMLPAKARKFLRDVDPSIASTYRDADAGTFYFQSGYLPPGPRND